MKVVDSIQQSMLIASLPRVMLLSLSPAFEQLAAGLENPVARAIALQDAQRVRRSHKVHAQLVRWASEWQLSHPDEAPETARHVEIGAFMERHAEIGALRHAVRGPALLFHALATRAVGTH